MSDVHGTLAVTSAEVQALVHYRRDLRASIAAGQAYVSAPSDGDATKLETAMHDTAARAHTSLRKLNDVLKAKAQ